MMALSVDYDYDTILQRRAQLMNALNAEIVEAEKSVNWEVLGLASTMTEASKRRYKIAYAEIKFDLLTLVSLWQQLVERKLRTAEQIDAQLVEHIKRLWKDRQMYYFDARKVFEDYSFGGDGFYAHRSGQVARIFVQTLKLWRETVKHS